MYRVIVAVIVLTAMFQTYCRYRDGHLSRRRLVALGLLWATILLFGFVPALSDYLARLVDIGEGANLFFFFSILFLLYVMLGMHSRMEKLQQDITALVRALALKELEPGQRIGDGPPPQKNAATDPPDIVDS